MFQSLRPNNQVFILHKDRAILETGSVVSVSTPANLDIADFNNSNIVLSDNREAMNSEIASLKQKSIAIINSIDFHKEMISNCDKILSELNPEFAEKQRQQLEINSLKTQMGEMAKSITELMSMNKKLISQLNKE